ncbi:MAG: membrane protein insertase YidC [Nocardioides sp.]|nr:membrane protein insertase YidC [Nocardioides sp.]
MSFLGDIGHFIMTPLYYAISVVLVGFHKFWSLFLDPASGAAWALSIVGLTVVIRAALIPLFVKQIKSSRNMQLLQPKVKELQKKYGHDRERLAQETMALYKDSGTNPFASCLPILLQMPIFIALFRLLDQAAKHGKAHGILNQAQAQQFADSELFGVNIAKTFIKADGDVGVQIMALFFVLCMLVTTFTTQRQLMTKNMPASAMTGQYAQQQKLLLYVLPVVFAVGGVAFPIGVLIYWTVSNLWTMCQQFYVIRNNPVPGTPAAKAKEERDHAKALRKGKTPEAEVALTEQDAPEPAEENPTSARQQPKKQSRSQRQGSGKKKPPKKRP